MIVRGVLKKASAFLYRVSKKRYKVRMSFCNSSFMPSESSMEQVDYSVVADSWLAEIRQVQYWPLIGHHS